MLARRKSSLKSLLFAAGLGAGLAGMPALADPVHTPITDEMIFNTIKNGRPGTMMSPFKDQLVDDQIWLTTTVPAKCARSSSLRLDSEYSACAPLLVTCLAVRPASRRPVGH